MVHRNELNAHFLFTQYSLVTFDNCPLKFKKRYVENLKWNTALEGQAAKQLERGNLFHLLAYRYFLGIEPGLDSSMEDYALLHQWMERLKSDFPLEDGNTYLPEYKLRMAEGLLKLEANFDLLQVKDGRVEIWDWKTHGGGSHSKGKKRRNDFRSSLQTMVYLFVLKEQGALAAESALECDRISMHYWQPDSPRELEVIQYSDELHTLFRETLEQKIRSVLEYDYTLFDKTLYQKHCPYCEFNWFCNNERVDFGKVMEEEDMEALLDWDAVEEII